MHGEPPLDGCGKKPGDLEGTTTAGKGSEGPSPNGTPAEGEALVVDGETILQVDTEEQESPAEDSPVMNFFKTLVSPSKTPKEEGAPPAVPCRRAGPSIAEPKVSSVKLSVVSPFSKLFRSKQSSKGAKPETTTKAIQEVDASMASKVPKPPPPPPPPEPPKLEVKGELAVKAVTSAQKEVPKEAAKEAEAAKKQKPAKGSPFLKLFHPKTGDSKAADVRVPPGQAPKEKKSGKSNLISLFKPMTPDTKAKEGTSVTVPTVAPDTAQAAAAKAETKPAAEAEKKRIVKQEAMPADGKPVSDTSQSPEDGTSSLTRRLEKRNSIHMFFKSLAPKWQSDAEVQTDPVTIIYPAK
ncbi:hypothetical protein SKAU_G00098760 [Synaphobranchus kaupii]|uniref:Uncharacterized protein n=1 Tax=Synaphobranchus kaupii TaxID=118154 RepID=A0A9Q1FXY8_SYNKA|nr:hypothetical protein SKAU_G00098760 [Synaphobranchus kaupii]